MELCGKRQKFFSFSGSPEDALEARKTFQTELPEREKKLNDDAIGMDRVQVE